MDRISVFNIFWQKYIGKNTFKISLQYVENELRHLCPLNPIPTPDFFSMGSKMRRAIYVPSIAFKSFKNSVPRLKNEPLKVLKLIVGRIYG